MDRDLRNINAQIRVESIRTAEIIDVCLCCPCHSDQCFFHGGILIVATICFVGVTLTPMKLDRVSQTAGVHSSAQPSVALPTPPAEPSTHLTDFPIFIENEALLTRRPLQATELHV